MLPRPHQPVLVAVLAVSVLLSPSQGWTRSPFDAARPAPPAGGFHATYQWMEQRGPLALTHEIHVYGNGHLRLVTKTGLGPAQEFNPPRNKGLADEIAHTIAESTKPSTTLHAPCGAPSGGRLTIIDHRGKKQVFDLFDPSRWTRFGALARKLRAVVLGVAPPVFGRDCRALLPGLQPRSKLAGIPNLKREVSETRLLAQFATARTDDERTAALAKLAWMRTTDPFFRFELIRRHPTNSVSQALLRYGLAAMVRQVSNRTTASWLLGRIGHRTGPDAAFHRALLQVAREDYAAAGRNFAEYYQSLARPKLASRALARGLAVAKALKTIRSDKSLWRAVKRAHALVFTYLIDSMTLAGLWPFPPAPQPALAILLTRRALHHARMAFFSRGPIIRGRLLMRARAFLIASYAVLTQGSWDGLPARERMDMLNLTGFLRRNPSLYRATGFSGPESIERSLVRMARLRRYREVRRFIDRRAGGKKALRAKLLDLVGRTYCRMEQWERAKQCLMDAARLGHVGAWAAHLRCLVEQGETVRAAAALAATPEPLKGAEYWIAASDLGRSQGHWRRAEAAARRSLAAGGGAPAHEVLGLALAGRGRLAQAAAELEAAAADPSVGARAWVAFGRMALAAGKPDQAKKAVEHLERPGSGLRGCGQALAAAMTKSSALQDLLARRALAHARTNPDALQCAADLLLESGRAPAVTYEMLQRVLALRPAWSRANAAMALLLFNGDRPSRAVGFVEAALHAKPHKHRYRLLETAIMRSLRSGAKPAYPGFMGQGSSQ